ncbi:hypothetical protein ACFQ1S_01330 [Kibdelosporangium lantanae]|uniref:Uncharacterized protein n=1 Tax=Kibdelosporangium lantanae TaxID=1497396 RepID=A0ABW3M338_9PSEU
MAATVGQAAATEAQEAGGLVAASGAVRGRTAAINLLPSEHDYSDQVVLLGRLKPGTVSESRRTVHVFPVTPDLGPDTALTARCGQTLPADDVQWLPGIAGMPCEQCVLRSMTAR